MRNRALVVLVMVLAACNGGGAKPDAGADAYVFPDAPDTPPTLTSFSPSPSTNLQPGVPTAITWSWTYMTEPVSPAPVCMIDNGVGVVTNGQMTMVTLNQSTLYRLSCSNRAGMTARDSLISLTPSAPTLATFTATPSPIMPNTPTSVTFNWTFTGFPSPTPVCTIDGGIGAVPSGALSHSASVTLPQARTYRLRCTSSSGTSFLQATVAVNECAGGTHECNTNATCADTADSYTCTCNGPTYTGDGSTCSRTGLLSTDCAPPPTATFSGGTCTCAAGYVGDGQTCTRLPLTFLTPTSGTGLFNASNWPGQNVTMTGLAAADQICAYHASQASLPGTYVAWLSSSTTDAYCRVHNATGKKVGDCGGAVAAPNAGPWVRTDTARTAVFPKIDKLLAPTRQTLSLANYTSANNEITDGSTAPVIWTGTSDTGEYIAGRTCNDWTDGTAGFMGAQGHVMGGGTSWTDYVGATDPVCSTAARLRCVEVLADAPQLPSRRPWATAINGRRAFVTSVTGSGNLSSWADAQGSTSVAAGDQICQARARSAGYANASFFKAWLAYYPYYTTSSGRIVLNGPWYRPDGVLIATSLSDLTTDTRLAAPMYMTEANTYLAGNLESGTAWTGARYDGYWYNSSTFSYACSGWASSSGSGIVGRHDFADFRWTGLGSSASVPNSVQSCSATDYRLYCFEDR